MARESGGGKGLSQKLSQMSPLRAESHSQFHPAEVVHCEDVDGCPSDGRESINLDAPDQEVLAPAVPARMKQSDVRAGFRIKVRRL